MATAKKRKAPAKRARRLRGAAKAAEAQSAKRRTEVLELRILGYTFRRIGRHLGISHVTARKHYENAIDEHAQTDEGLAKRAKDLELERLDLMLEKLGRRINKGDPQAVTAALRISDRRARLLGLDEPDKHEHQGKISVEQLQDLLDQEEDG